MAACFAGGFVPAQAQALTRAGWRAIKWQYFLLFALLLRPTFQKHSHAKSSSVGTAAPPAPALCEPSTTFDTSLFGAGRCTNAANLTASAFACLAAPCPALQSVDACALVCMADPGCTGFELRPLSPNSTVRSCFVMTAAAPTLQGPGPVRWPWTAVTGTQASAGRTIAKADISLDPTACCYKRSYPRPNPPDNPVPTPPVQSKTQAQVFALKAAQAHLASQAALPQLTALIDFCAVNATTATGAPIVLFGAEECPGMADLLGPNATGSPTTAQILSRFDEELLAMEFGHGFTELAPLVDPAVIFNPSYSFLLNLFEPCALGLNLTDADGHCGMTHAGGGITLDLVLEEIFGVAPPVTGNPPLDFHEAADRVIYSASNYKRSPLGNTLRFGVVNAILRPKYVAPLVMFTPSDSWHYQKQFPNCTSWPNCTVGTMADHYHILLAWMTGGGPIGPSYTPAHVGAACADQMDFLSSTVCARPPTHQNPLASAPCPMLSRSLIYWESDLMGSLRYPEGVKFMLISFSDHFGTVYGETVREWCIRNKWALAWVIQDGTNCLDPRRLLDPVALAETTVNTTLPGSYSLSFTTLWNQVNASRSAAGGNFTDYAATWVNFVNESVTQGVSSALLWTFGVRDCADFDNCLGLQHASGDCVCYLAASSE